MTLSLLTIDPLPNTITPFRVSLKTLFRMLADSFHRAAFGRGAIPLDVLSLLTELLVTPHVHYYGIRINGNDTT